MSYTRYYWVQAQQVGVLPTKNEKNAAFLAAILAGEDIIPPILDFSATRSLASFTKYYKKAGVTHGYPVESSPSI